jgi:hypothetical protein
MYTEQVPDLQAFFKNIFDIIYCVKGVGDGYQAEGQLYHAMLAARTGMLSQELQAVRSDNHLCYGFLIRP